MKFPRTWGIALLGCLAAAGPAMAGVEVDLCYDYGCLHQARLAFTDEEIGQLRAELAAAADAVEERRRLAEGLGQMYAIAAARTPVWRDWGRNALEERYLEGAMDCIDHSTNTATFLRVLADQGALRFHRPAGRTRRFAFLVFGEHWAATLAEVGSEAAWVVDSWFFDPGKPPVVVSLERWKSGYDPASEKQARP